MRKIDDVVDGKPTPVLRATHSHDASVEFVRGQRYHVGVYVPVCSSSGMSIGGSAECSEVAGLSLTPLPCPNLEAVPSLPRCFFLFACFVRSVLDFLFERRAGRAGSAGGEGGSEPSSSRYEDADVSDIEDMAWVQVW